VVGATTRDAAAPARGAGWEDSMKTKRIMATAIVAAAAWLAGTLPAHAQATVSKGTIETATATIKAVDQAKRTITIETDKGESDTFSVGPEIKRFDEFKAGQKVKMTYYESVVYIVRKPGEPVAPASSDAAVTRGTGALPGATIATQEKTTVTVKAIDKDKAMITVTAQDGSVMTRKVEDKKNLDKVAVGDRIEITYTRAVLTNLEAAK